MKLSEEIRSGLNFQSEIQENQLEEWADLVAELKAHCKEQEIIVKMQRERILKMKCCCTCLFINTKKCDDCDETFSNWELIDD